MLNLTIKKYKIHKNYSTEVPPDNTFVLFSQTSFANAPTEFKSKNCEVVRQRIKVLNSEFSIIYNSPFSIKRAGGPNQCDKLNKKYLKSILNTSIDVLHYIFIPLSII